MLEKELTGILTIKRKEWIQKNKPWTDENMWTWFEYKVEQYKCQNEKTQYQYQWFEQNVRKIRSDFKIILCQNSARFY